MRTYGFHFRHGRRGLGPAFAYAACGPAAFERAELVFSRGHFREEEPFGAGGLGVRRPLRWLAWRLDLDSEQVASAAKILERLKLERAQAAVDLRRAAGELADAMESGEFARARVESAGATRLAAAQHVQQAVARALEELHALLDSEQREKLAALIRGREIAL
jgi:hypothetical protein